MSALTFSLKANRQGQARRIMRAATRIATEKYGPGGQFKSRARPKPITLPRLKFITSKEI